MKRIVAVAVASLMAIAVLFFTASEPVGPHASLGIPAARAGTGDAKSLNPCAPPGSVSADISQTAWQLWVAATCPVNAAQYPFVVWQNWIEQAQQYPTDPSLGLEVPNAKAATTTDLHVLHGSPLTLIKNPALGSVIPGLLGGADQNCNKAATPPAGQPNLVICEEVRLNGGTSDYIAGTNLWNRPGQANAATNHATIQFGGSSVEIKSDWISLASIGLDCSNLPSGFTQKIHVETIHGNCFGLAGMHLISKLLDQWIWATFEPQSPITNPNRCQVLGCTDTFGSNPKVTHGTPTALTPQLTALMTAANLAPEWFNYRLDGVQTGFFQPKLLGNSIIEGENAGVPLTQSSCITCHSVSSVKNDGTDGITLLTSNPVGAPTPLPSSAWILRDFVWSLSEACPNSPFQSCAISSSSAVRPH
jgi:hypothetical protein